MIYNETKAKVSQDFLYQYLTEHDVKLLRLQELMGVSYGMLNGGFRHGPDRHGKPMWFTADTVALLNKALAELSRQLRGCLITFGSAQVRTGHKGIKYDPAAIAGMDKIAGYFKKAAFCKRVLGWSSGKTDAVLGRPQSNIYGNISADDVAKVNAELLSVAGMFGGMEVEVSER